jgi:uncharacterized Zn finger protein (UPF0148 family)
MQMKMCEECGILFKIADFSVRTVCPQCEELQALDEQNKPWVEKWKKVVADSKTNGKTSGTDP